MGKRHAPRVLLADEVGLGKTVEAALIIQQQLLTNRAQRVLIVVPSSLVHQWLVEMLRRVNLPFSIFDEERCQALAGEMSNPFESEQLVLCSLDFLTHNSRYYQQALEASWDLMVVDEAHHLTWSEGQASQEYQVIEGLANITKGVLLLTATPDQLGHESHFARLRLLDPARFHDYHSFVEEEKQYTNLAQAIDPLLSDSPLSEQNLADIQKFTGNPIDAIDEQDKEARDALIKELLDRHGTGRVLFRNSRSGVTGFPKRELHTYPLALPEPYKVMLAEQDDVQYHLTPERHASFVDYWTDFDPRTDWFIQRLADLKGEKLLTICAKASTALQLAEAIRIKTGVRASVFHEGMSIVERDRAANYFAQSEDGAQVLICSEIGSEGRNFQFAHHLVLFDLPRVPDLLEQRIGRLDRIGQKNDVKIHVPYFQNSAQQIMLDWYHQGLNAFEHTCPTGTVVYEETNELLLSCMFEPENMSLKGDLLTQTQILHEQLKARLEQGRDKLLELNSSGKGRVESFLTEISESEDSPTLERFMTQLFDALGVLQEEKDDFCYLLRPTESMHTHLPGLDEEGMTVTYERKAATQLEHVHFLSWDNAMVHNAMDMIITEVTGKSSIGLSADKQFPAGIYWLECLFVLSSKAQKSLQLERFLPPTPIRLCIDAKGQLTDKVFYQLQGVNQKTAQQLATALQGQVESALNKAHSLVAEQAEEIKQQCLNTMQLELGNEFKRLVALQKVNPAIRHEEIEHIATQISALTDCINQAELRLEAIRLIVNNH